MIPIDGSPLQLEYVVTKEKGGVRIQLANSSFDVLEKKDDGEYIKVKPERLGLKIEGRGNLVNIVNITIPRGQRVYAQPIYEIDRTKYVAPTNKIFEIIKPSSMF